MTEQSAVCSPAVAEIVAAPADTPITTPSWLTYATAASELFHMTVLSVALAGVMVAESCMVWPTLTVIDVILRLIPVTGITLALTVTKHTSVLPPSFVFTVTSALPSDLAVTSPSEETAATSVSLEDQETVLSVASSGITVAVKAYVSPSVIDR